MTLYKNIPAAVILALVILLSGCATYNDAGAKEQQGVVMGAIIGGIIGSKVGDGDNRSIAIIVGAAAGAFIGGQIGRSMDEKDQQQAAEAALQSLQSKDISTATWNNPASGNHGRFTSSSRYKSGDARVCRSLKHEATINGQAMDDAQRYCLTDEGMWKPVEI
ncbi:MAG: hypothetical protein BMS9Abin15_0243 [Gammaproteobacteria bacterium]|nr:MAG: hypothetical protein BMS9Abin15_0243 [Gammaproteobacteria bacterium]